MDQNTGRFDPYHKWLGIHPKDQPPNHYRLLGIDLFEPDCDVIRDAALQRMAHIRTYQLGKNAALSQQILNELAAAKVCLLDPERKAAYDTNLREKTAPLTRAVLPAAPEPASRQEVSPSAELLSIEIQAQPLWHAGPFRRQKQWWRCNATQLSFVGGAAACLIILAIFVSGNVRKERNSGIGLKEPPASDRPETMVVNEPSPPVDARSSVKEVPKEQPKLIFGPSGAMLSRSSAEQVPKEQWRWSAPPRLESAAQLQFTNLADLQESEVVVAHPGWFSKEGKITILDVRDRAMLFQDTRCPRSIYMHPPRNRFSRVVFRLDQAYQRFKTDAAIPRVEDYARQGNAVTPLTFEVLGDGTTLWQSAPLQFIEVSDSCDISIKGVKALELRVNCPGADNWAIAAWIEPRLYRSDGEVEAKLPTSRSQPDTPAANEVLADENSGNTVISRPSSVPRLPVPPGARLILTSEQETISASDGKTGIRDISGNGHVVELRGGKIVPGRIGTAISLDDGDQIVIRGNFPGGAAPRTLAAWIRAAPKGIPRSFQCVAFYGSGEIERIFGIATAKGEWYFFAWGKGYDITTRVPVDTRWHHHTVAYDGKNILYYYDAHLVLKSLPVSKKRLNTQSGALNLGAPKATFSGDIDELILFDRVLTPQEVKMLFHVGVLKQPLQP
jgi:hypothetical protein